MNVLPGQGSALRARLAPSSARHWALITHRTSNCSSTRMSILLLTHASIRSLECSYPRSFAYCFCPLFVLRYAHCSSLALRFSPSPKGGALAPPYANSCYSVPIFTYSASINLSPILSTSIPPLRRYTINEARLPLLMSI